MEETLDAMSAVLTCELVALGSGASRAKGCEL